MRTFEAPSTHPADRLREETPAFRQAVLKSERLRIHIVVAAIGASFVIRILRTIVFLQSANLYLWALTWLFFATFLVYELWLLHLVNRAIQNGKDVPSAAWITNIVVETCLPALALVFLSNGSIETAYKPLANPVVLLYFIFIMLSTLRLDPALCRSSGITAAVSYLFAAAYLGWVPKWGGKSVLSPERAVIGFALAFVVAGFVSGAIAAEIRRQVDAALREAETKHQVELLRRDLEVARSIQQSLLPTSTPQIEGFEIAGWNQPADQTGGDYYDWQVLPDGRLLVALGDVTGHGIGPALLAAVCRAYVRAHFTPENGLLTAMTRVNSALSEDVGQGRFVTFVAVICTPGSSRLELLSAGHGPLFLYWLREDRVDAIPAQGLPLGLMPKMTSEPQKVLDLNSGDLLVLTTDGFFEWGNAKDEQFGIERLEASVRASRRQHPDEIITSLYRDVLEFAGGTQQEDDLTAVVIKKK